MWKELVEKIPGEWTFKKGVTTGDLEDVEQALNMKLEDENDIVSLLKETDGIEHDGFSLIYSTGEMIYHNLELRDDEMLDLYMPFDCLLFISDAGNGDYFGFPVLNGKIPNDQVFVWRHEDDSRIWVAGSLREFIELWSTDRLEY
ncbi:SMI1/KNR4 family protein [Bacillus massiliigorillae]|uniref:SMI1/KNR4 family protein n=1 Tax=Bacillus massiliigorillae TaxID=1243664 RepID=UPI0003A90828|nr:SMI1/KNR4 family protein [Bacillus massiliigorillae]